MLWVSCDKNHGNAFDWECMEKIKALFAPAKFHIEEEDIGPLVNDRL